MQLTRVEQDIVNALVKAGGEVVSLFRLADLLDISYSHAHLRISVLEIIGLIEVERQKGRPLIIKLTTPMDTTPTPTSADDPVKQKNGPIVLQTEESRIYNPQFEVLP